MSFIDEEGIMGLIEQLLMHVLSTAGVDKKPVVPFPRMSYSAALSQVCAYNYSRHTTIKECLIIHHEQLL